MGSDFGPFFQNMFLYYYENKRIIKMKTWTLEWIGALKIFLESLSDCGESERNFYQIHPPELELKKEYPDCLEGSFLENILHKVLW